MNKIKNINRYRYNLLWMVEHFTYSKKANQLRIDLGNKLSEKISSEFRGIAKRPKPFHSSNSLNP